MHLGQCYKNIGGKLHLLEDKLLCPLLALLSWQLILLQPKLLNAYTIGPGSTEVGYSTHNPKIVGLNPSYGTGRQKTVKK